jgi:hypothetical protein
MTSTPCEKTSGGDNSKLVENRTKQHEDDYLPISEFYKGRSIFITGGEFLLLSNFSQYFTYFFSLTHTRRKRIYGKSSRGEVTTIMSRN